MRLVGGSRCSQRRGSAPAKGAHSQQHPALAVPTRIGWPFPSSSQLVCRRGLSQQQCGWQGWEMQPSEPTHSYQVPQLHLSLSETQAPREKGSQKQNWGITKSQTIGAGRELEATESSQRDGSLLQQFSLELFWAAGQRLSTWRHDRLT